MTENWINELYSKGNPEKAKILSSFFKTGKGEYGEGDVFIGVTVPDNRAIAKKYYESSLGDISEMLKNQIHEIRLSALLALVIKFKKKKSEREEILKFYIDNCSTCNNWDLVDLSAPYILGEYMVNNPMPELLEKLSESENFWKQRIAIVSTLTLIRHGRFMETLKLAEKYLSHKEPLIHKATGWTLREIGKKDIDTLRAFLDKFTSIMPRTALRYAIERLEKEEKAKYMAIKRK